MSVSIKVAVRCRPFTKDLAKLGVQMLQNGDENGEINLLESKYTTNRFAFTYSWWSAYGWQRHIEGDQSVAEAMHLVNQTEVYESVGEKIKADLLDGNAVVLFAYGLSGSGKTFTVFGPDAPDLPEAWFKHAEPTNMWGIFPRLAYDLFAMKQDGWKITMKYFQNVVDTVRDLMSPIAQEQHYKSGMKKDADGFMDIEWCTSVVLNSWNDLRRQFMIANERKAIAPTQFNHQSTRGHCIMTLEVEKPHPDMEGMKQKGRVYVCDLAGTEPAGDIVFANYEKKVYEDGTVEHRYIGPNDDDKKTKELQDQGKKINLSLSEMAQFFMKMAEAVKKNQLKPGMSIPGCNSYFLCKFLKDTMLNARTYLFCAIRPEVDYHNYTYATLGFAKNASVVKLQPKKATIAASDAERKLMAELDEMRLLVAELTKQNANMKSSDSGGVSDAQNEQVMRLNEMLEEKQRQLMKVLGGDSDDASSSKGSASDDSLQKQREEYKRRGIDLVYFAAENTHPYFINLDEDPFRSSRFMYILDKECIQFGNGGDIQPLSLNVVAGHCQFRTSSRIENNSEIVTIELIGGKGEAFKNGVIVAENEVVQLLPFDRIALGGELLLLRVPGLENPEQAIPTAEDAVTEYQLAVREKSSKNQKAMDDQFRQFQMEKEEWEKTKNESTKLNDTEKLNARNALEKAMLVVDGEILDLLPKLKEARQLVNLLGRNQLLFDVSLQRSNDSLGIPKVKIRVENTVTHESTFLDTYEFIKGYSILKDELSKLKSAVFDSREHTVPERHDPVTLLFDATFHLGTATMFPEFAVYGLDADDDEKIVTIKSSIAPYNRVGVIEVNWTAVPWSDETTGQSVNEMVDIDDETQVIGKKWAFKISIGQVTDLPVMVDVAYCQYQFMGEIFTTETLEQVTHSPTFSYSFVHQVSCAQQDLIDFLRSPFEVSLFISPYVEKNQLPISSNSIDVRQRLGVAVPVSAVALPMSPNIGEVELLKSEILSLKADKATLLIRVAELEREIDDMRSKWDRPVSRSRISDAIAKDKSINGGL